MKDNFVHVCFVIDQSGSMFSSIDDVKGGFKKIVEEQKANTTGTCAISMFTFDTTVHEIFIGKDVRDIDSELNYNPGGCTAMNDGIGTAIDSIGKWLCNMDESERPCSNLIVIMTDGQENSSREYSLEKVREMIKHQTEKYSWTFMYLGADVTTSSIADSVGIKVRSFSSKQDLFKNYAKLNIVVNSARQATAANASFVTNQAVEQYSAELNDEYAKTTGIKLDSVVD